MLKGRVTPVFISAALASFAAIFLFPVTIDAHNMPAVDSLPEIREVKLDIEDDTLGMGGFPGTVSEGSILSSENPEEHKKAEEILNVIGDAVSAREEKVDLSGYDISKDDAEDIVTSYLNDDPGSFSVDEVSVEIEAVEGDVTSLSILYEPIGKTVEYEKEAERVLSLMDPGWNDEEKLFFIHDYLVTHCGYDLGYYQNNIASDSYTAYGALVKHVAVCAGYALAFKDLAEKAGIKADYVSSERLNHAWNIAELNGKHYYIDCTWDDPNTVGQGHFFEQRCRHKNLLLSRTGMAGTGHDSTDWTTGIYRDSYIYDLYDDKEYDEASWRSAEYSPVVCIEGGILYLNTDDFSVYGYGCDGEEPVLKCQVGSRRKWDVFQGNGYYYSQTFGTLALSGNSLFVNDYDTVYSGDIEGNDLALSSLYELSEGEKEKGQIYGIDIEGSFLRYNIATWLEDSDYVETGTYDISSHVSSLLLDKNTLAFKGKDDSPKALSARLSKGGGEYVWSSLDEGVAKVDAGTVSPSGYGKTYVTVSSGSLRAWCSVFVDTAWQDDYYYYTESGRLCLKRYTGSGKEVSIPDKAYINGRLYTASDMSFSFSAFENCAFITKAELPDGIERIPANLFYGCKGLKAVRIPESVISIGSSAFEGTDSLTDVYYGGTPEKWREISQYAGLSGVKIHYGVETVLVSFDLNGGYYGYEGYINPLKDLEISKGNTVKEPERTRCPYKDDCEFTGWYLNRDCTEKYDFSTKIQNDITLYAGFKSNASEEPSENGENNESNEPPENGGNNGANEPDNGNKNPENGGKNNNDGEGEEKKEPVIRNNDPENPLTVYYNGFSVNYYYSIPFWGSSKATLKNLGRVTVSYDGAEYPVTKVKINKKKHFFSITGLSGADKSIVKAVKRGTKGAKKGIYFDIKPYYVKGTEKTVPKFNKKNGLLKSLKIEIFGKAYKLKKKEYEYNPETGKVTFRESLEGEMLIR